MALTLDKERDLDPKTALASSAPSAYPSRLGLISAPATRTDRAISAPKPVPSIRLRRRFRISGYEAISIMLILSCTAFCVYRLLWAVSA